MSKPIFSLLQTVAPLWRRRIEDFLEHEFKNDLEREEEYNEIANELDNYTFCIVGEAHDYDSTYIYSCIHCRVFAEGLHHSFDRYILGTDSHGLVFSDYIRQFVDHFRGAH
jgi:hypothetical protein